MKELPFCQSCAMPLQTADQHGTNEDGSRNEEYCVYCYQNGAFTKEETMEEMIETCIPFLLEDQPALTPQDARKQMLAIFPQLKRWKH